MQVTQLAKSKLLTNTETLYLKILSIDDLYLQLLSQESNPGIEFEYSVPAGAVKETPPAGVGYEWFPDNTWTECSAPCGGGTRLANIL